MAKHRVHTLVIGAGQSGLATGYYLAQEKADFVIVDAGKRVGDPWRTRWDSLRLFTEAHWNDLPGEIFPAENRKTYLPSKDEAADFVEAYARKNDLPVKLGVRVRRLSRSGDGYVADAGADTYEATNVVVATGPFQRPRTPEFAGQLDPGIVQMHSVDYRNPSQIPDGPVLVVGAATSGCQIAMELAGTGRKVYLAGRSVESMPPALEKFFTRIGLAKWIFSRPRDSFIGKKLFAQARTEGHPLVGFTYKAVAKAGVERVDRMTGVAGGKPQIGDRTLDVKSVIWCTGFSLDFSWIDLPIFAEDSYPRHVRGVVEEAPGLYFVGLVFLHSLSSQLMLGVPRDTRHVVDELLRRSPKQLSGSVEPTPASRAQRTDDPTHASP